MKKIFTSFICLLAGLLLFTTQSFAQSDEAAVKSVIVTLFDGMREADSAKVHSTFIDEAKMQTIAANRQGEVRLSDGSLANFLQSVGTPHEKIYDERILDYQIKIDGAMASVWTPYEFYFGEDFSHCGVNSFQLMKGKDGWKIIYLVDTRRRQGCK